jgi:MFS family permease
LRALLGASLLSAAAGLPLHLLPLLIAAVIAQGKLPLAQAGWVASACLAGQLVASIVLPLLGFTYLKRNHAAMAIATLLVAVLCSSLPFAGSLLVSWFVVGLACGNLYFLATTTAAAQPNREAAFAVRLSLTLVVSGLVIFALQLAKGFNDYATLAVQLSIVFAVLTLLGLWLYEPPQPAANSPIASQNTPKHTVAPTDGRWYGLLVIFIVFVGQPGFWAYAVQNVQQRGIALEHVAYGIAVCKLAAGLWLYVNSKYRSKVQTKPLAAIDLLLPGLVLVAALLCMSLASLAIVFMLGVLLWELSLNVLSARLQAAVVNDNPTRAGVWLTAAVFLGAATGPALHGLALQLGAGAVFVAYACMSALVPFVWLQFKAKVR